jgi:hypothetical protein
MAPPVEDIQRIERHFGIPLPPTYKAWATKGYTDFRLKCGPYLRVHEAEWIPPIDIPDYQFARTVTIPGLMPFAFTGAGDEWCWNGSKPTEDGEFEVIFCWRDQPLAERFAPSFPAWFYRQCLVCASGGFNENRSDEGREYLRKWGSCLEEIHSGTWSKHLSSLANLDPFPYHHPNLRADVTLFGFITAMEVDALVAKQFGNKYLNEKVEWGRY